MLHILVVSGNWGLVARQSSGNLGIPSRTSSFGKYEKTLQRQQATQKMRTTLCSRPRHDPIASSPCTIVVSEGHWVTGQVQGVQWAVPQSSQSFQGADGVLRHTKMLHCWELWQLTQTHKVVVVQV